MRKRLVFAVAAAILFTPRPSYAYIDPNAGSLLAQLIIGGVGILALLRLFWARLKARLRSRSGQ